MTARWEQALEMVVERKLTLEKFMAAQNSWVTGMVDRVKSGSVALKVDTSKMHTCPDCQSVLMRRKGSNGFFWACSGYPECRTTFPDEKGKPGTKTASKPAVLTDIDCPKCHKHKLREITSKKGQLFLGCSGYPDCDHTQWPVDESAETCAKCGTGKMIERTVGKGANKGKKFHSCSNYPKCENTVWPDAK